MANTTNVPAPTFGASGFIAPSPDAILAGVQADINAAFGNNLSFDPSTPQGQIAASWAAIISNVYQLFVYYSNQTDPLYASGRMQDAIGEIYFIERDAAEPTSLQVACLGLEGVVIPAGALIQDVSNNRYAATDGGTIDADGTITLGFACTLPGPIAVPGANDVSIYQVIAGWDAVAVVSGTEGTDVEGREAFEQRRAETVAGNSFGPITAILGAVAQVSGVLDFYGYNNNTSGSITINGVLIAAFSIYICVAGGSDADVAQAIYSKKSAGAPMVGNTTVTVSDLNPLYASPPQYTIKFERPDDLQILMKVIIANGPLVPADAALQIQTALLAAFAGDDGNARARINSTLWATRYVGPVTNLGAWAQVTALTINSKNSPTAVVVGHISGNTFTVTAVTSGAVAVGQALFDENNLIANATYITATGTGSGGIGTYIVNNPQTVAGAAFTGNGSGTNLTASAVTGSIGIGDVITGTGVPASTTIVSQTSGTPGGAGVYVTNNATTSSGASLTANAPIDLVTANQAVVQVQADQEPQLTAANIVVSLT